MNSIESFKHLSNVGESGARWLSHTRYFKSTTKFSLPSTGHRDPEWKARVVACTVLDCFRDAYPDTGMCYGHSKGAK